MTFRLMLSISSGSINFINIIIMETNRNLNRCLTDFWARFCLLCLCKNSRKLGQQVWSELNAELPEAVGASINDEPRVRIFAQKVRKLSRVKQYALRKWLKLELHELEHNFSEFTSMQLEEYERRTKQIYRQHLEAMP